MRFRQFVALTTALVASVVTLGSATAGAAPRGLVIGSLAPETGALAPILTSIRTPVQMAVDEMNAAGGVDGAQARLSTADEGDDAAFATARAGFDRLVADGAQVVIGPTTSGTALALQRRIGDGGVLTCSGSDTAAPLAPDVTKGYYFRTAPPDRLQGLALSELVLADGHSRPAVLFSDDFYGSTIDTPLVKALKDGGAKVVENRGFDPAGAALDQDVQAVLKKKPDSVILIGFAAEGAALLEQLAAAGVTPSQLPMYGSDDLQRPQFREAVPDVSHLAGLKGTAPAASPSGVDSPFTAAFAATGVDPIFSAHSYDCAILAGLAAVAAKSTDPAKLRHAFTANLRGKNACNTFAACKDLLESGKTIHWRGASSTFDDFGKYEPNEGAYDTWSWDATGTLATGDPSTQITVSG